MARIPGLRRLLSFPRRSDRQIDREIDDEVSFHIDMVTSELVDAGVPPADARDRARKQFGDVGRARRTLRVEEQGIERDPGTGQGRSLEHWLVPQDVAGEPLPPGCRRAGC